MLLDTNTVLALWMFRDPALAELLSAVERGAVLPVSRADTLEELRRVLAYRQFGLPPEVAGALLDAYRARCLVLPPDAAPVAGLPRCSDPDDQKFLELALAADARWLLTRDKALLRVARHRLLRDRLVVLRPEVWIAEWRLVGARSADQGPGV